MNLQRILDQFPDKDCRRIDLMIGEKQLWGRGIGTEVIRMLTEFGFEKAAALMKLMSPQGRQSLRRTMV